MKIYTQLFEGGAYSSDLLEAVFVPKKEVEAILTILKNYKRVLLDSNLQDYDLCKYLSNLLKNYKILFVYENTDDENNFFSKGKYNHISDIISIPCLSKINYIVKDDNFFTLFLKTFQPLIGHELVHRMEYIQRALENLSNKRDNDKIKKYLSDHDEIMSYAWQSVEELRYRFGEDQEILKLVKSDSPIKYRVSYALTIYKVNFSLDDKVTKLLYKYIYLYLDSNEAKR
jgi:hypothetical protein